jgi:phage tail-like protein
MTAQARQPKPAGVRVEVKVGSKTVSATFAEMHLSIVHAVQPDARPGAAKRKSIQKITGMNKSTDVTLKRGVVSAPGLIDWLNDVRNGKSKHRKLVVAVPKSGTGSSVVRWQLAGVSIVKYTGPALSGKSNDVAIEELVLTAGGISLE